MRLTFYLTICVIFTSTSAESPANETSSKLINGSISHNVYCYDHIGCITTYDSPLRPCAKPRDPKTLGTTMYIYKKKHCRKFLFKWKCTRHLIYRYPDVMYKKIGRLNHTSVNFIIHGAADSSTDSWVVEMATTMVTKYNQTVVTVDWSPLAEIGFPFNVLEMCGNLPVVANETVYVIKVMREKCGLTSNNIHMTGHSYGADLSSMIAKSNGLLDVPPHRQMVNSLFYLDCGRPMEESYSWIPHPERGNAKYIVALHTDANVPGFGWITPIADKDIYVNGGVSQPGCPPVPDLNLATDSLADKYAYLKEGPIGCSHWRAWKYYNEALEDKSCTFWAYKATLANTAAAEANALTEGKFVDFFAQGPGCLMPGHCVPLGLDTPYYSGNGTYNLITAADPPYCIQANDIGPKLIRRFVLFPVIEKLAGLFNEVKAAKDAVK